MIKLNNLSIRASAGSGKTYQLANRYLALLLTGAPSTEIIALTFTRKAAGEFADRILSRLAAGASSDAGAAQLAEELKFTLHGDVATSFPALSEGSQKNDLNLKTFQRILEDLVANLHRVSLGTLDSFFIRIVKQFPFELGLANFTLIEGPEVKLEQDRALSKIYSRLSVPQRDAFLGAFRIATLGKEGVSVVDILSAFLNNHHESYLQTPSRESWGQAEYIWPNGCPWSAVDDFEEAAVRMAALVETVQVEGKPRADWVSSLTNLPHFFALYKPGDGRPIPAVISRLLPLLPALKAGDAVDTYHKKEYVITGLLAEELTNLVGGYVRAEIEQHLTQTQGLWAMLWAYESVYATAVRNRGRLGFSDVTMLLSRGGLTNNGRAQLDSRLDARYGQWLLDEFQDTSRAQWQVLAGLLDEAVLHPDQARSLFVVGDTKQSIYGWRGGEPRLFDEMTQRPGWNERMETWGMATSWRSRQEVLDLANLVCSSESLRSLFPSSAVDRWDYQPHRSALVSREKGFAAVIETGAGDNATEACLRDLLTEIQPLERGWSCALLVRTNSSARALVTWLRAEFPEMPIELDAEIHPALDNPLGTAFTDLFRWLAHPSDRLAQGHVFSSPLGKILRSNYGDNSNIWTGCRNLVAEEGIATLMFSLVGPLRQAGVLNVFLEERLELMLRAAVKYDETGGHDLDEWIAKLESLVRREFSSRGALQVMTVHKAKGLEFDVVVLPDIGTQAFDDPSKTELLKFKDQSGRVAQVMLPGKRDLMEADPELKRHFDSWASDQCYERFCNLYVGLTRAKEATYVLLPKEAASKPKNKRRYDLWIREAIQSDPLPAQLMWNGNEWSGNYAIGDSDWFLRRPMVDHGEERTAASQPLGKPVARRRRSSPSKTKSVGEKAVHENLGVAFGNVVHEIFQAIEWIDGNPPVIPDSRAGKVVSQLLSEPSIRHIFENRKGKVTLFREQAVEAIYAGEWISGVVDRLHVSPDSVEVIDFKTDVVEKSSELVDRYHTQMTTYRQILELIYPSKEVRLCLVSTHLAEVIELFSSEKGD